ncbi:twin-arginine translocase TatA/TatE family subunit [Acidomonas methanolica]|uniref:Sec-independent protein translocase protein TatA n=1 Tax=Acidomonas methanolica NBRC 104435 TaxID=1231351 RepID=A0A023D201_ACIMT|nr:twin-arginine translocase TatA/TatE family subunit [Acidomonas methanolica]GAJ27785.1 Sec-independent protein translocase protein TatA/E-like protein [Acidomonas methanolica NBRC 104435]MBU2654940.1 twin-arginine translocase TatA/TatE family subunit [Acidomonas methanolica]MCQ9155805.1 twin-arginine translocase TatA/TatE family subunit [Acidomonas methanolica]TCS26291.1 sec-independent protein translocase protein TatA [Acidomonas methanolica]GBQ50026.1 Sec-independent protein translocase pr
MGSMSPLHWLIVLAVVLILFGGGSKISGLMGDFAKGIKAFKKNMADDESLEQSNASSAPTGHIQPPQGYAQQPNYTAQPATPAAPPSGTPHP